MKKFFSIIIVSLLLTVFVGCGEESPADKAKQAEQDKKTMLITTTQEAVKERLKSPSTSKFPWGYDEYNIKETNSTNNDMTIYNVAGYVDAENSFGAKLRNNFIVKLECTNDLTKYRVLDVEIN